MGDGMGGWGGFNAPVRLRAAQAQDHAWALNRGHMYGAYAAHVGGQTTLGPFTVAAADADVRAAAPPGVTPARRAIMPEVQRATLDVAAGWIGGRLPGGVVVAPGIPRAIPEVGCGLGALEGRLDRMVASAVGLRVVLGCDERNAGSSGEQ